MTFAVFIAVVASCLACHASFDAAAWGEREADMAEDALRMKEAYDTFAAKVDAPAKDVSIPFERFPNGKVKAYVAAQRGQIFSADGFVWAEDLSIKQLKEDGSLDMRLDAEHCLVDVRRRCCWIEGHVRAEHRKTIFEGDNAYCNSSNDFIKVMSNVKMTTEDIKMKGLKL